MESPDSFGCWLGKRRKALDLTREEFAQIVGCSISTLRKIESDERRPSKQLAELMANALEIRMEERAAFLRIARGELAIERLTVPPSLPDLSLHQSSQTLSSSIPTPLTPLIGREAELSALGQMLGDPQCRLITLVGPGGIGKTRLAIEVANQYKDRFPDGVWFVPLAPLNSTNLIVPTIADSLDFKFSDPTNTQAQLLRYLHLKRALLVLDNAEHLLDGVGVFTEILEHCPQVNLLVTSRELLNLLSEWVFEIRGLLVPTNEQVEQMEAYSSVALFLQSARRVQAGFALREEERQWVRNICHTMEGTPLGIELSAAWVGLLSCEEIAKEIERNLDFLTVSMRDLPERHRSMRATLDHSWKLLNDEEKCILSRLSVFQDPFRREAAEEICGANFAVLSSLRNKTLLYRTDQDYFSLHELVRQYAERKLAEDPGEQERVKDWHAAYYVRCLAEWEKALKSSRQVETFNQMAQIIDNLSLGWLHMITNCQPKTGKKNLFCADLIHQALFSLSLFYEMRCRSIEAIALFKESVAYLRSVQDEFEATEDSSRFISVLGHITAYLGLHHVLIHQYRKASEYLEEAIQLLGKGQARVEKAQAQVMLAAVKNILGQIQESIVLLEQCRSIFREEGEDWWYLLSIIHLAHSCNSSGKLQESEALHQEGFRLVEPGDLRLGLSLRTGFACLLYLKNDFAEAEQWMQENLQLADQLGNSRRTAANLFNLGRVALATQRIELAEEYIQKSIDLLGGFGELFDLTMLHIYLGKCFAAQTNRLAARDQFRKAIKIGQEFDLFHLVYWGLANIARTYLEQGQTEKALEIALVLKDCAVEYKIAQEEGNCLLADLQAMLPTEQAEVVMKQGNGRISADQAAAAVLAYALEHA